MEQPRRVLGIDTGLATCGWAIVEKDGLIANKNKIIEYGTVDTTPDQSTAVRLSHIYEMLTSVIDTHKPQVMAIESLFYFKNQKTVMGVSQARGVILLAGAHRNLPMFDYTPLQVKTAMTGYGRAQKKQIQKMVQVMYALEEIPKPDDAADAIAVATCHLNTYR